MTYQMYFYNGECSRDCKRTDVRSTCSNYVASYSEIGGRPRNNCTFSLAYGFTILFCAYICKYNIYNGKRNSNVISYSRRLLQLPRALIETVIKIKSTVHVPRHSPRPSFKFVRDSNAFHPGITIVVCLYVHTYLINVRLSLIAR